MKTPQQNGVQPEHLPSTKVHPALVPGEFEIDVEDEQTGNVKERATWTRNLDFLLCCVGNAVGLGNVWRFPYLCFRYGGGAFLIPYVIMVLFAGVPILLFELSIGQFASRGAIGVWNVCPLFKGIGWSVLLISAFGLMNYNVIIAWSLYYLFASFTSSLPWLTCDHDWNDEKCTKKSHELLNGTFTYGNQTYIVCNKNMSLTDCVTFESPAEQYWERKVLGIKAYDGKLRTLDDGLFGKIDYPLALCLLLAWVFCYACLVKGIHSIGKVVYFTALFPYVVLLTFVISGCLLPGAVNGIRFYMIPDFQNLKTTRVWAEAAIQIFYSLSLGAGSMIGISSYNGFKSNCYRNAILVPIINGGTSIFAGFAIFSVIGHMAHVAGVEVSEVAEKGVGLAFVAYPQGISTMPVPTLFAILFFLMLVTLGLDSQFTPAESILTEIYDHIPALSKTFRRKLMVSSSFCFMLFLIGLPMTSQRGLFWFMLLNDFGGSYAVFTHAIFSLLIISYVYGIKNFLRDLKMMLGFTVNYYWIACWCFITPALLLFILFYTAIDFGKMSYHDYVVPGWFQLLGWLLVTLNYMPVPLYMIFIVGKRCKDAKSLPTWKIIRDLLRPNDKWGPGINNHWLEDPFYTEKLLQLKSKRRDLALANASVASVPCQESVPDVNTSITRL